MTNDLILQPESVTETSQADHTANIKARDNHRSDKNSSKQQFQYNGSFREKEYLISQKKVGLNFHLLKFSSAQIFVTLGKFCHLGPTNNLGRRKFGRFLKFHIAVKFVFKYDISSFRLVNSHYML